MKRKIFINFLAIMISLVFMAGLAYAGNPTFKLKVNGQDIKAVVQSGETVPVELKLNPSGKKGREANYFAVVRTGGDFYFLQPDLSTWDDGIDIYESSELPIKKSVYTKNVVFNLPEGDYVLYVGAFVDTGIYYDTIYLQVLPDNKIPGSCGSANGGIFSSAPTENLCLVGTPGQVTGIGPWYWPCPSPNGGTTAECSANKTAPPTMVDGVCGSANGQTFNSMPTANLCSAGSPGTVTLVNQSYFWGCIGINGGDNACCSANKEVPPTPINGICGSANGGTFTTAPTTNLCSVGTPGTTTADSLHYYWPCPGTNGGVTAYCTANKTVPPPVVNGTCGSANGQTFNSTPSANLCATGTAGTITADCSHYYWPCNGQNGGVNVSCSANKESLIPAGTVGDNWVRFKIENGVLKSIYFNLAQVKLNTTTSNSIAHPFQFGTYNGWTIAGMLIHNVDWGYINVNINLPIQVRFTYGGDNTGPQSGWSWVTNLTGSTYFKPATNDFCVNVPDNGTGTVTTCP